MKPIRRIVLLLLSAIVLLTAACGQTGIVCIVHHLEKE